MYTPFFAMKWKKQEKREASSFTVYKIDKLPKKLHRKSVTYLTIEFKYLKSADNFSIRGSPINVSLSSWKGKTANFFLLQGPQKVVLCFTASHEINESPLWFEVNSSKFFFLQILICFRTLTVIIKHNQKYIQHLIWITIAIRSSQVNGQPTIRPESEGSKAKHEN